MKAITIWVTLLFLGIYLLLAGEGFYSTDGETMLRTTWAIVDRGRLSIPCDPGLPSAVKGRDSACYSRYGLGQPIIAIPLYGLGKAVAWLLPSVDYGPAIRFAVSRLNQIVMAIACGVLAAFGARLYRSVQRGVLLALIFGLSTLALPYARFYFNEPLALLSLLLAVYALLSFREHPRTGLLIGAGVAFGWAVLTRTTVLALLPLLVLYLWLAGRTACSSINTWLRWAIAFVVPILALTAIQFAYQAWAFGNPIAGGYAGEGWETPLLMGLSGLLFSPGKSLILFVPLMILVPWAWLRLALGRHRAEAFLFASLSLVWLILHASWWTWHGGWSWGPRFLVPILPFLVLPIGELMALGAGTRWTVGALAAVGFLIELGGVAINFGDYMMWINDEEKVLFNPAFSPLWGHWRMLFAGKPLDLALGKMTVLGAASWTIVCLTLIALSARQIWRNTRGEM